MEERRRYKRENKEFSLQLNELNKTDHIAIKNSFCRDISCVGLSIFSFDFYPVNQKVHLKLYSSTWNELLDTVGKIIWVRQLPYQNKYRIGIEFTNTSQDAMKKIKTIVESGK
ncbi:MAG: PilZ domain-containing protein [Candidatus Omnitrophota bacterium]